MKNFDRVHICEIERFQNKMKLVKFQLQNDDFIKIRIICKAYVRAPNRNRAFGFEVPCRTDIDVCVRFSHAL